MMTLARGFGLLLESEIPIPGAIPAEECGDDEPIVRIRWSSAAARAESAAIYEYVEDGLIFSPPGIGDFYIRRDSIDVAPLPGADSEHAQMLLIATALPALLWLRGEYMLHAAAIVAPGQKGAIAITGSSGAGKSTLAHRLVQNGSKLVADDSICLRADGCDVRGSGLAGGLFLRTSDRHFQGLEPDQVQSEAPMSCIVVLDDADGPSSMVRLSGLEATQQILRHRHRPAVPALLGLAGRGIKFITQLASHVPVLAWRARNHWQDFDSDRFLRDIASALDGDGQ